MKLLQKLKNNKHGFSLVELIVVIAIMAVIAVVLIPSLLRNVEESRAEKDVKSTDELVSAVELSLSDQDVYDELVEHSVLDNIACYIDKDSESEYTDNKTILKDGDIPQYTFNNDTRRLDESLYFGAGNMRGLTITFSPVKSSNETEYILKNGIINKFVARNIGHLGENQNLYNNIRQIIGDKLKLSSQTYRNSDFTVFIRMGTVGGNQASAQDAVQVWGQFNGTNLSSDIANAYQLTSDRTVGEDGIDDMKINIGNQEEKIGFHILMNLPSTRDEKTNAYKTSCRLYGKNIVSADPNNWVEVNKTHRLRYLFPINVNHYYTITIKTKDSINYPITDIGWGGSFGADANGAVNAWFDKEITTLQSYQIGYLVLNYKLTLDEFLKNYEVQVEASSTPTEISDYTGQEYNFTSPVEITESDKLIKRNGLYGWSIIDSTTGKEKAFYPLPDNEQKILYNFEKSFGQ